MIVRHPITFKTCARLLQKNTFVVLNLSVLRSIFLRECLERKGGGGGGASLFQQEVAGKAEHGKTRIFPYLRGPGGAAVGGPALGECHVLVYADFSL